MWLCVELVSEWRESVQYRVFIIEVKSKPKVINTKIFINNEFVDAASEKTFATIDPSDELEIAQFAEGDRYLKDYECQKFNLHNIVREDVDLAVKAARQAFHIGSAWMEDHGCQHEGEADSEAG